MRKIRICLAILLLVFCVSCAKEGGKPFYKKLPPREKTPSVEDGDYRLPPEIAAVEEKKVENVSQRKASMGLVEKGIGFLENDQPTESARLFQSAVDVDGSNGVAYYYLAVANHKLGEDEAALGLLEKADTLFGSDRYWSERIENLRAEIDE
ncbi:MAG: hypothetical protein ABIE74_03975 [Pseudomonadota bacterium]